MTGPERVLVVAAHPDDEILGCGGTVARHVAAGDTVWSMLVCEGESMRYGADDAGHQDAAIEAARVVLGVDRVLTAGLPDQRLDTLSLVEVITPIEEAVDELAPTIVYCHHGGDVNRDHQLVFEAVLVATRPTRDHIRCVAAFETVSSTEWGHPRSFVPDTWVDISATLDDKLAAMACYERELRPWPHPRSIEALRALAQHRGSEVCVEAAEAFMTVRRVWRDAAAR